jgi:hypothetical protein
LSELDPKIDASDRVELGNAIRTRDAYFHTPDDPDPTWTETNWFGFLVPEAHLRGSIYQVFRTNLGVARSVVRVFSQPSLSVLDLDYIDDRSHIEIPPGNLDDYRLSNGVSVHMTEPMKEWHIRFEGRFDTELDLRFEAMMPPLSSQETKVDGSKSGYAVFQRHDSGSSRTGHLDQTMWVSGSARIRGREFTVDFPSNRDHSWSPRRDWGHNLCGNFDEGHFGRDFSFHVQTRNEPLELGEVTHGYVLVGGVPRRIRHGLGHYHYEGWRIAGLRYELEDNQGRSYKIDGVPVSWCQDVTSGVFSSTAVVRWELDGQVGWGDLKWHWDVFRMQEYLRSGGGDVGVPTA